VNVSEHARSFSISVLRAPFDIIALIASAGGIKAICRILHDFPLGFHAAVLVMQHLSPTSDLVGILSRRFQLPVSWINDGARLLPGQVQVCPPRKRLRVLPDGTCCLTPYTISNRDRPNDYLLESLADNFGPRALGIILTGMGKDGAAGARTLKEAGGTVLVQSEDTAEEPSMPHAAIAFGGASFVLPLHEIGPVVVDVMS